MGWSHQTTSSGTVTRRQRTPCCDAPCPTSRSASGIHDPSQPKKAEGLFIVGTDDSLELGRPPVLGTSSSATYLFFFTDHSLNASPLHLYAHAGYRLRFWCGRKVRRRRFDAWMLPGGAPVVDLRRRAPLLWISDRDCRVESLEGVAGQRSLQPRHVVRTAQRALRLDLHAKNRTIRRAHRLQPWLSCAIAVRHDKPRITSEVRRITVRSTSSRACETALPKFAEIRHRTPTATS